MLEGEIRDASRREASLRREHAEVGSGTIAAGLTLLIALLTYLPCP